jgi:hypothetical protein
VRLTTRTRILAVPAAVALGVSLFAVSLTWQVPGVHAASVPGQARELVRLMNGARAAAGKVPLAIDVYLESKATDGAIPCPDDAAKTIAGRTKDFATYGTENHNLRLCDAATYTVSGVTFVSVMQSWGYGNVGEILGLNGGYGTGAYLYAYKSYQTWTYATTGHMMAGWQSSSSHWGIVMGNYDRVGCGAWLSGSTYFYACEFAKGGPSPSGLVGAPAASPFPSLALPTPKPTPPPPAPVKTPAPTAVPTPSVAPTSADYSIPPTPGQSDGSSPSAVSSATPIAEAFRIADATATTSTAVAAGLQNSNDLPPSDASAPAAIVRLVPFVAGSLAGLLSAILALISVRRRRRETAL